MMKLIAILLSNLILLQSLNIGLETFSKINVLIEHAQFHQKTYGDSFIDFLTEHYGFDDGTIEKHKEHGNLPFKNDCANHNHLPTVFTLNTQVFELKETLPIQVQQKYYYKESYSFIEKPSVFQPPKHA